MNILFLTDNLNFTSGVTTHLLNLTRGLEREKNIRLYLICGESDGLERFKDTKINITVNKHFLHKKRGYINYSKALLYLSNFIKRYKINIVHSHTHYAANLAAHAARHRKICTVQTNHGILPKKGKLNHFKGDKIVAINEHIYEYILRNKIAPADDIKFIRCGIEVPAVPPKKIVIKLKVLSASRLSEEKGLDIFIKAVSLLPKDDRESAEFIIAGEGEEENRLKTLNEKLKTGIKFLGRVTNMPELLRQTHIFVFPSRSTAEGFPSVITEAAAYNNLIIAAGSEYSEPVFQSDIDGMVFKNGDEYDLMIKIKMAIDGYKTFKPMAEHFYSKVKELYRLKTMIQKHIDIYEACLIKK